MPEWFTSSLLFLVQELPKVLKQNLWRTVLATIALTLLIEAAFLNPLFGSTKLKAGLFSAVIGEEAEVEQLIGYISSDDKAAKVFRVGAARAGYYTAQDATLLEEWEEEAAKITWDGRSESARNLNALRDARERAELLLSPFQIVGKQAKGSSPGCTRDRPGFDKVFVNPRRQLGRVLKPGDTIKVSNSRGGGNPVIAKVDYPDTAMPPGIDLYLNKYQMLSMLGQIGTLADLRVSTVQNQPNQTTDDDYPDDPICVG